MANSTSIAKAITKLRRLNGDHSSLSPLFYSSSAAASLPESLSGSSLNSVAEKENRSSRWSKWLLFLPGAMSFGLGTWQIFRRQDKVELLEYRKKRLELEPLKWNQAFESSASLDFRRVLCDGAFDEERSVFVGPRSRSISGITENGYYVITPFVPNLSNPHSLQSAVLVNRGWVPKSWRDKSLQVQNDKRHQSKPESHEIQETETTSWWKFWANKPQASQDQSPKHYSSEIIGIVRGSENPSIFVPENEPRSGQWFYVDVPAIARACGLPEDTLYIEDINENVDPSNPYPIPKDVNTLIRFSVMPQDHLNYTLTWYSLSAAVTFMAFKRIRPTKIRR